MKTWTVDEMMSHRPCPDYSRERVIELWAGRDRLSVLDLLDLDIPADDRVWACLQAGDHVEPVVERIVTRAINRVLGRSGVPEWESWASRWLSGEDRTIAAAEDAAVDAASAALEAAGAWVARAAARAATWAARAATWAARAAAWAAEDAWADVARAAREAAREWAARAAREAAREWAARAAERDQQLADIREVIAQQDTQPCGHPPSAIVSSGEGTHYCGACVAKQNGGDDADA